MKFTNKIVSIGFAGCILLMTGSCAEEKMEDISTSTFSVSMIDHYYQDGFYYFKVMSEIPKNSNFEVVDNKVYYVFKTTSGSVIETSEQPLGSISQAYNLEGFNAYENTMTLPENMFSEDKATLTVKAELRAVAPDGSALESYDYESEPIALSELSRFVDLGLSAKWSVNDDNDIWGDNASSWACVIENGLIVDATDINGMPFDISGSQYDRAVYSEAGFYKGLERTPKYDEYQELTQKCTMTVEPFDSDLAHAVFTAANGRSIKFIVSLAPGSQIGYWTSTYLTEYNNPIAIVFEGTGASVKVGFYAVDPTEKLRRHTVKYK